jgi:hypothetical protein
MPQTGVSVRRDSPRTGQMNEQHVVLARDVAAQDMEEIARSGVPRHVRSAVSRRTAGRRAVAVDPPAPAAAPEENAELSPYPQSHPGAVPGRRTITITGRGAEGYAAARRRPQRPLHERPGFRPDRFAMWAVLLGVLLVLVAATSSHAAMRVSHAGAARVLTAAHR